MVLTANQMHFTQEELITGDVTGEKKIEPITVDLYYTLLHSKSSLINYKLKGTWSNWSNSKELGQMI